MYNAKENTNLSDLLWLSGLSLKKNPINESVDQPTQQELMDHAQTMAKKYNIPYALLHNVIQRESNWNPRAKSSVGAQGLAQLMPSTAQQYGVDAKDPYQNIQGSANYLSDLWEKYNGNVHQVLSAYNAGPAVTDAYIAGKPFRRKTKDPSSGETVVKTLNDQGISYPNGAPFKETTNYQNSIISNMKSNPDHWKEITDAVQARNPDALASLDAGLASGSAAATGSNVSAPTADTSQPSQNVTTSDGTSQYSVGQGDTLSQIAQSHGTSVQELMKANPSITNPDVLQTGQQLSIPSVAASTYAGGVGTAADTSAKVVSGQYSSNPRSVAESNKYQHDVSLNDLLRLSGMKK
jgi:LysM repeat protein